MKNPFTIHIVFERIIEGAGKGTRRGKWTRKNNGEKQGGLHVHFRMRWLSASLTPQCEKAEKRKKPE